MYNVIFMRDPYKADSDDNYHSTDGVLNIFKAETVSDVDDIIKTESLAQINLNRTEQRSEYGEWGFAVLKDGNIIAHYNFGTDIDFNDYTDESKDVYDIHHVMDKIWKYKTSHDNFIRRISTSESDIKKGMQDTYKEMETITKERAQLKRLLEKYPDMGA